jgi:hypothetical protein
MLVADGKDVAPLATLTGFEPVLLP